MAPEAINTDKEWVFVQFTRSVCKLIYHEFNEDMFISKQALSNGDITHA